LGSGIHLILGPNESGKTTLCRAIRGLLWPGDVENLLWEVESSWVTAQGTLLAKRVGSTVCWVDSEGEAHALDSIPEHLSRCHWIGLDEIVPSEGVELADVLAVEMSAGIDLEAIRAGLKAEQPKRSVKETEALKKAQDALQTIRAEQFQLRMEEKGLESLLEERKRAHQARAEEALLERALERNTVNLKQKEVDRQLEALPSGVDRIRDGDEEFAEKNEKERCRIEEQLREAEEEEKSVRATLSEVSFKKLVPTHEKLDEIESRANRLDAESKAMEVDEGKALGLAEKERFHRKELGAFEGDSVEDGWGADMMDELDDYLQDVTRLREFEGEIESLGVIGGIERSRLLMGAGVVVGVATFLLLALIFNHSIWWIGGFLPLIGGGWVITMAIRGKGATAAEGQKDRLKAKAEKIRRLNEKQRDRIRSRLGFDPGTGDLNHYKFGRNLIRYQEVRGERLDIEERVKDSRAKGRRRLKRLNAFLEKCEESSASDAEGVRTRVQQLRRRLDLSERSQESLTGVRARSRKYKDARRRNAQERTEFYERLELTDGDRGALEERIACREEYRELQGQRRDLEVRRKTLDEQLAGNPELIEQSSDQLTHAVQEARLQGEALDGLSERIGNITGAVKRRSKGRELEQAMEEEQSCRQQLEALRDRVLIGAAELALLELVIDEVGRRSQPVVLQEAVRLLTLFTRGRYQLRIRTSSEGGGPTFRVFDNTFQQVKTLDELSSGTRLQLHLAVRVAFATVTEGGGETLPILLDEALSGSDPQRTDAVIESLGSLAEEGRQILYFSSDPVDRYRWERGVGKAVRLGVTDLFGEQAQAEANTDWLELPLPERVQVPEPQRKESATSYARRIGVTGFDPYSEIESMHLFHVLHDDLAALHLLLSKSGVQSIGALVALIEMGKVSPPQEVSELFKWRFQAGKEFLLAWRVGRGLRCGLDVLIASGAVSEKYQGGFVSILRDHGGRADSLRKALEATPRVDERVKGYQAKKQEELLAYLEQEGYLVSTPPLDREAIGLEVVAALGSRGPGPAEVGAYVDYLWQVSEIGDDSAGEPGEVAGE
jgi:hypothetical protein